MGVDKTHVVGAPSSPTADNECLVAHGGAFDFWGRTCAAALAAWRGVRVGTRRAAAHRRQSALRCGRVAVYGLVDMSASVAVALLAALPALAVQRWDVTPLLPLVCTGALHAAAAVQVVFLALYVVMLAVSVYWEPAFFFADERSGCAWCLFGLFRRHCHQHRVRFCCI
jgi:hypothetical protein